MPSNHMAGEWSRWTAPSETILINNNSKSIQENDKHLKMYLSNICLPHVRKFRPGKN